MMNQATIRAVFRWIHIVFAIPIIGYVYSPFNQIPNSPTYSVCFRSFVGPFGTLDVERSCRSAACFEKIGVWHRFVLELMIFDRQFPTPVAGYVGRN